MDTLCRFNVALFALLALAANGVNAQDISQSEHDAISREVLSDAQAFLAALRDRDIAHVIAHVDDQIIFVSNGRQRTSIQELRPVFDFIERLQRYEGEWIQTQVIPLARDAALFHAVFRAVEVTAEGATRSIPTGYWTALYRRIDGRWKMVLVHESYRSPSTEPN